MAVSVLGGTLRYWRHRRLLKHVNEGKLTINGARAKLGLPPWDMPEMDVLRPPEVTSEAPGGAHPA